MSEEGIKTNGFAKTKVQGFLKDWEKAQEKRDEIVREANEALSAAKDDILERAENLGIQRRVMRNVIAEVQDRARADARREKFAELIADREDKGLILDQRDAVALAADLPLFDQPEKPKE